MIWILLYLTVQLQLLQLRYFQTALTISCKTKPDYIEIAELILFINIAKYRTLKHKSSFPRRNYIVAGAFAINLTLAQRIIIQWHGNSISFLRSRVSGFHLSGEVGSGAARPPSVLAQPFVGEPDRIFKVSVSFDR